MKKSILLLVLCAVICISVVYAESVYELVQKESDSIKFRKSDITAYENYTSIAETKIKELSSQITIQKKAGISVALAQKYLSEAKTLLDEAEALVNVSKYADAKYNAWTALDKLQKGMDDLAAKVSDKIEMEGGKGAANTLIKDVKEKLDELETNISKIKLNKGITKTAEIYNDITKKLVDLAEELYDSKLYDAAETVSKLAKEQALSAQQNLAEENNVVSKCAGCFKYNRCFETGKIIKVNNATEYCAGDKQMKLQKQTDETCAENYECIVYNCVNSKCQLPAPKKSFWARIFGW